MNSVQRSFWKLNFGLSNKQFLLLFSLDSVLAFGFITFQLETKIVKETKSLAIKRHSEQKLCTVSKNCFYTKPFFFHLVYIAWATFWSMAMRKRLIDLWTTYGDEKKEIWKKRVNHFFCSRFYSTHWPCLTMGCLNRLFTFSLPNHYSIMALALQFFL